MAYKLKLILFLLLLPCVCFAAPTISGVTGSAKHNGVIIITGSDFTAKATAEPIRWEDNEGYTVDQGVDTESSWWTDDSSSGEMVISNEQNRHSNSTREWKSYLKCDNSSSNCLGAESQWSTIYKSGLDFASTGKILVSFWIYWDSGTPTPEWSTEGNWQVKGFRTADGAPTSYPSDAFYDWFYMDGASIDHVISYMQIHDGHVSWTNQGALPWNTREDGKWYNVTIVENYGTQGTSDGDLYMYHSRTDFGWAYSGMRRWCWFGWLLHSAESSGLSGRRIPQ